MTFQFDNCPFCDELDATVMKLKEELSALRSKLIEAERDAERWNAALDRARFYGINGDFIIVTSGTITGRSAAAERLTAAIDAALSVSPENTSGDDGRAKGMYRLVYNKTTKTIDKVRRDGLVVESFDPPEACE